MTDLGGRRPRVKGVQSAAEGLPCPLSSTGGQALPVGPGVPRRPEQSVMVTRS